MAILTSRPNQLALLASAILFALQYTISFSSSQTFAKRPYLLDPLKIGLILLAFGGGNVVGSVLGGISSDRVLKRLKEANGVSFPQVWLPLFLFRACADAVGLAVPTARTADEYRHVRLARRRDSIVGFPFSLRRILADFLA